MLRVVGWLVGWLVGWWVGCVCLCACVFIFHDNRYGNESSAFTESRTFEEFTFGWANLNNATKDRQCLPNYCNQTTIWWDTCWDNPAGLLPATKENDGDGVGSPFIPFILLTVLLMRPISSVFQAIYEIIIRALTKLENWPTLEKYNVHYTQRKFISYFLDVRTSTMTCVLSL